MVIIIGEDKLTRLPVAYGTHADAVQCNIGGEKKKLSDVLDDLADEATDDDIRGLFT